MLSTFSSRIAHSIKKLSRFTNEIHFSSFQNASDFSLRRKNFRNFFDDIDPRGGQPIHQVGKYLDKKIQKT